jgi:hypothetical protein
VIGDSHRRLWPAALLATTATVLAVFAAAFMALFGATATCLGGGSAQAAGRPVAGPEPTEDALREIPPRFLKIYREAGTAFDISWPFLASIGYQECGHGTGDCYVVSSSGCAGPMEMAYVRGSACSPDPSVPTIWERFRTDGDGDGKTSIFDPADAVFTAAKLLRKADGAPPARGPYSGYHQAACNYYGACGDSVADYADEVMARAVEYGFGHEGRAGDETGGTEALVSVPLGQEGTGGRHRHRHRRHSSPTPQGSACEASATLVSGGASGDAIVRVARSQLGVKEAPLGSNCTKYGPCVEWCALFVAWVWQHAGVEMAGGTAPYAYSGSFYDWVEEHGGRDLPPTATPSPGDAVMFGTAAHMDHVGIVESVFAGTIVTIDGNFSDQVSRVGPFHPARARAEGEPASIFAYAEPPGALPSLSGVGGG